MKGNLILTIFIIVIIDSCRNADMSKDVLQKESIVNNSQATPIDSVSNSKDQADYVLAHLDDPHKVNRVINSYVDLLEKSLIQSLPAKTDFDHNKDSSLEFFITKKFYKDLMEGKPITSILLPNDEMQFMGDAAAIQIPDNGNFHAPAQLGEVIEMAAIYRYKLNDSVYAYTLSQLRDPDPTVNQFPYNTYLLAFDETGQYVAGWETNYYSYGTYGVGHQSNAEITKDGRISILYSITESDPFLTTHVKTVFEITISKQINRVEYKKSSKQE